MTLGLGSRVNTLASSHVSPVHLFIMSMAGGSVPATGATISQHGAGEVAPGGGTDGGTSCARAAVQSSMQNAASAGFMTFSATVGSDVHTAENQFPPGNEPMGVSPYSDP